MSIVRIEEARYIAELIESLDLSVGATCLNIGSSSLEFRDGSHASQAKIVSEALERRGLRVLNCDIKDEAGVDIVGDVLDPVYRERLREENASLLLCNNILEHLTNPREFARCCAELVTTGGYAIVSLPKSYPYHPDPIDTMLRLTPVEVAAYFPGFTKRGGEIIKSTTFLQDLLKQKPRSYRVVRHFVLLFFPFHLPKT